MTVGLLPEILNAYNNNKKDHADLGRCQKEELLVLTLLEVCQKNEHFVDISNLIQVTGVKYRSLWNLLKHPRYSKIRMKLRITPADVIRLNASNLKLTRPQMQGICLMTEKYHEYQSHSPKTVAACCYKKYFECRRQNDVLTPLTNRVLCNYLNVSISSLTRLQRKIEKINK